MGLIQSFVDNVLREKVTPIIGSMVYCDLLAIEKHSGIYVGNNQIVHLQGDGNIAMVTPERFLGAPINPAISIYVSCNGTTAVGSSEVAARAKNMVGNKRKYNVILDNCHQFTSGCLTGDFENNDNFILFVKHTAENILNANTWRVWEID